MAVVVVGPLEDEEPPFDLVVAVGPLTLALLTPMMWRAGQRNDYTIARAQMILNNMVIRCGVLDCCVECCVRCCF